MFIFLENPELDTKKLGAELKRLRGSKTLKQVGADLAIDPMHLSNLEGGRRTPSPELLIKLAHYYNRSSALLFAYLDEQATPGDEGLWVERKSLTDSQITQLINYRDFLDWQNGEKLPTSPEAEKEIDRLVEESEREAEDAKKVDNVTVQK